MKSVQNEFEIWLFETGRAPRTIESYASDVKGFQRFLLEQLPEEEQPLSRFSFVSYKEFLVKHAYKINTVNKKINSLRVYNEFLRAEGVLAHDVVNLKRDKIFIDEGSIQDVTSLSETEVEKLLTFVEDRQNSTLRNQLIVNLLLYTGLRVSELINIRLEDIDFLTNHLQVVGKGGKWREIPLKSDVLVLLRSYIQKERSASVFHQSEYLLLSQRAERLQRDAVRNWLTKISGDLGFKLHPHKFRHTFCKMLTNRNVDLITVSKLAGHSNLNMTKKYINTTREEKLNAINRL